MFRVQYFCPIEGPEWKDVKGWLFPVWFDTQGQAERAADSLIFKYHSARVLNRRGEVVYTV